MTVEQAGHGDGKPATGQRGVPPTGQGGVPRNHRGSLASAAALEPRRAPVSLEPVFLDSVSLACAA
jgi:hypothetical protein